MKLRYAFLCRYANFSGNHSLNVSEADLDTIFVLDFPSESAPLYYCARLQLNEEELNREFEAKVFLAGESPPVMLADGVVTAPQLAVPELAHLPIALSVVADISHAEFTKPGEHSIHLLLDDSLYATTNFVVVQIPDQQPTEPSAS